MIYKLNGPKNPSKVRIDVKKAGEAKFKALDFVVSCFEANNYELRNGLDAILAYHALNVEKRQRDKSISEWVDEFNKADLQWVWNYLEKNRFVELVKEN